MKLDRFINRPVLSTVISVLIVILGIIGLATLPVTQYPDIAPPTVQVRATYTGANSTAVLNSVIAPLEDQINGVENMMYIQSSASNNGAADINVYFNQGTDPDMAAVNVQNRVSMAQGLLPAEVTKVGVTTQKRQNSMLMVFSLYDETDSYNIEFIENYANINLIPEIKRVKGVGDANVLGQDYSMRIWLKPDVMAQYKLVPTDVSAALAEQNIEAAPGQFGERGNQTFQYTIRYKGRLQQTTEFEDIVIKALPDGNVLRLGDVADIELGRLAYTFNNMVNGHKAVSCIVYQMAGSNATETISDLEKVLAKAQESLPTGLNINMPELNGFEVAAKIRRQNHQVLIFFLSDRSDKADRLKGFDLQANDYLAKPFYPEELLARIRERFQCANNRIETESYTFGKSTFNYTTNEIRTGNNKVLITSRQAEILRILAKNLHVPVDREILLKHVWGTSSYANSLALNVQITYLRKALRNDSSVKIESLMKKGYVLHTEKGQENSL